MVFDPSEFEAQRFDCTYTGVDPRFQVRGGGGGGALKKFAPRGISCEKSRFYAINHIFSNFRGGGVRTRCGPPPPPPWIRPCYNTLIYVTISTYFFLSDIYFLIGIIHFGAEHHVNRGPGGLNELGRWI